MLTLATFIQHWTVYSSQYNKGKKLKASRLERSTTVFLCRWYDPVCRKILWEPIKKLLELINKLNKIVGYKIDTQKSIVIFFFCLCPWHVEIPGPGIKTTPQQWPKPQQWQFQILNLLSHQGTPQLYFYILAMNHLQMKFKGRSPFKIAITTIKYLESM